RPVEGAQQRSRERRRPIPMTGRQTFRVLRRVSMATAVLPERLTRDLSKPKLLLIDGKHVPAQSGKTFEVLNPATEEVIAICAEAGKADVDLAVKAARRSFEEGVWRNLTGGERAKIMFKFADLVEENLEEIALTETMNNGMPIIFARGSVAGGLRMLRYFA